MAVTESTVPIMADSDSEMESEAVYAPASLPEEDDDLFDSPKSASHLETGFSEAEQGDGSAGGGSSREDTAGSGEKGMLLDGAKTAQFNTADRPPRDRLFAWAFAACAMALLVREAVLFVPPVLALAPLRLPVLLLSLLPATAVGALLGLLGFALFLHCTKTLCPGSLRVYLAVLALLMLLLGFVSTLTYGHVMGLSPPLPMATSAVTQLPQPALSAPDNAGAMGAALDASKGAAAGLNQAPASGIPAWSSSAVPAGAEAEGTQSNAEGGDPDMDEGDRDSSNPASPDDEGTTGGDGGGASADTVEAGLPASNSQWTANPTNFQSGPGVSQGQVGSGPGNAKSANTDGAFDASTAQPAFVAATQGQSSSPPVGSAAAAGIPSTVAPRQPSATAWSKAVGKKTPVAKGPGTWAGKQLPPNAKAPVAKKIPVAKAWPTVKKVVAKTVPAWKKVTTWKKQQAAGKQWRQPAANLGQTQQAAGGQVATLSGGMGSPQQTTMDPSRRVPRELQESQGAPANALGGTVTWGGVTLIVPALQAVDIKGSLTSHLDKARPIMQRMQAMARDKALFSSAVFGLVLLAALLSLFAYRRHHRFVTVLLADSSFFLLSRKGRGLIVLAAILASLTGLLVTFPLFALASVMLADCPQTLGPLPSIPGTPPPTPLLSQECLAWHRAAFPGMTGELVFSGLALLMVLWGGILSVLVLKFVTSYVVTHHFTAPDAAPESRHKGSAILRAMRLALRESLGSLTFAALALGLVSVSFLVVQVVVEFHLGGSAVAPLLLLVNYLLYLAFSSFVTSFVVPLLAIQGQSFLGTLRQSCALLWHQLGPAFSLAVGVEAVFFPLLFICGFLLMLFALVSSVALVSLQGGSLLAAILLLVPLGCLMLFSTLLQAYKASVWCCFANLALEDVPLEMLRCTTLAPEGRGEDEREMLLPTKSTA